MLLPQYWIFRQCITLHPHLQLCLRIPQLCHGDLVASAGIVNFIDLKLYKDNFKDMLANNHLPSSHIPTVLGFTQPFAATSSSTAIVKATHGSYGASKLASASANILWNAWPAVQKPNASGIQSGTNPTCVIFTGIFTGIYCIFEWQWDSQKITSSKATDLHLAELIPCRRAAPSLGLDCFCHKVVFVHCSGPRRFGDFSLHRPFSSFFFKAREHVFSIHWYNLVYTCIYIILNLLPSNRFASVKQINLNPFQLT